MRVVILDSPPRDQSKAVGTDLVVQLSSANDTAPPEGVAVEKYSLSRINF